MDISQSISPKNRDEWRAWLEQHHASEAEIWIIFYKKRSGVPSVTLDEAVEEALCYGWIDGLLKRLDEQRYALRFTPRKNQQNWSERNRRRVVKLARAGRMTPAGLAKINFPLDEPVQPAAPKAAELPEVLLRVLQANPTAWTNFEKLPPSHKGRYIGWILSAKQDETQLRRTAQAAELLEYDLRLGMESPAAMLEKAKAERK